MALPTKIHWAVPATTLSSLLVGVALALGHHLFYATLDGRSAPTDSYVVVGANISRQQLNTAVGTAFAFLVKAALALSVGISYTQIFWRRVKESRRGWTLGDIDTAYSVLSDALSFLRVAVWRRRPTLFLLAVISWCDIIAAQRLQILMNGLRLIPIASIVTPATLSVESAAVQPPPSRMAPVPQFDYVNLDFLSAMKSSGATSGSQAPNVTEYCYDGPGHLMERVATAVAAQGEILPIAAPAPNASWTLSYHGPALQCEHVTGEERLNIWRNVFAFTNDPVRCTHSYGYISWDETSAQEFLPFQRSGSQWHLSAASIMPGVWTAIYVATIPQMFNVIAMPSQSIGGGCQLAHLFQGINNPTTPSPSSGKPAMDFFSDATLLRCEVRNASCVTAFQYVDGRQTVNTSVDLGSTSAVTPIGCVTGPYVADATTNYTGALQESANTSCSTLNTDGARCKFDPSVVRTLSYQAVADSFTRLVQGTIGLGQPFSTVPSVTANSSIDTTVLMDTTELGFVGAWQWQPENVGNWVSLQSSLGLQRGKLSQGLANEDPIGSRGSLAHALEQLFENITLSILSEPYLQ